MGVGILSGVQNKYNCEEEDMMGRKIYVKLVNLLCFIITTVESDQFTVIFLSNFDEKV